MVACHQSRTHWQSNCGAAPSQTHAHSYLCIITRIGWGWKEGRGWGDGGEQNCCSAQAIFALLASPPSLLTNCFILWHWLLHIHYLLLSPGWFYFGKRSSERWKRRLQTSTSLTLHPPSYFCNPPPLSPFRWPKSLVFRVTLGCDAVTAWAKIKEQEATKHLRVWDMSINAYWFWPFEI